MANQQKKSPPVHAPKRQTPITKVPDTVNTKVANRKRYNLLLTLFLLTAAVWAGYHHTLNHPFHFDDTHAIINNKGITSYDTFKSVGYWIDIQNRPLSNFTFALNYHAGELNPKSYHITNILIHILSSLTLFLLVWRIFLLKKMQKSVLFRHRYAIALFSALLFAVHPLQTEAVTYIVQRMTALYGLFYLAAITTYLHGRETHITVGKPAAYLPWYSLTAFFGALALMSNQTAASLPLVLLAAEFVFITNKAGKPYRWYLIAAVSLIAMVVIASLAGGIVPAEKGALARIPYMATQAKVVVKYLQLVVLPFNLSVDYAFPVSRSFADLNVLLSLLIHVVLITLAFLLRQRNPLVAFGIFLFYIPLTVTSTLIPIRDIIFEHRMYLSVGGAAMTIITLLFMLYRNKASARMMALPAILVVLLTFATYQRNLDWKDSCTLWQDALDKTGGTSRSLLAVGDCFKNNNDHATAFELYRRSLEIDSNNATTLNNRGNLKLKTNDIDGAIKDYTKIIAISPEYLNLALLNRGMAFIKKKAYLKAVNDFTRIIETDTADAQVYFHRALAYTYLGDYQNGLIDLRMAHKIDPKDIGVLFNLASSLMNTDQLAESVEYFNKLLDIEPNHLNGLHYRGVAYYYLGRRDDACRDWRRAANQNHAVSIEHLKDFCQDQSFTL